MITIKFKQCLVAVLCLLIACPIEATTKYVSQNAATPFVGGTACNGQNSVSVATHNAASDSAGDTIYVCGPITSQFQVRGNGSLGNVISYIADTGASIQIQGTLNTCPVLWNNHSHILFDGGGPGGTNGIIAVLNNGSTQTSQSIVNAWCTTSGGGDIEIRGWMIGPLYLHTSLSDNTSNEDQFIDCWLSQNTTGNFSFHDNVCHDAGTGVLLDAAISNSPVISIYNNTTYNVNWSIGFAPPSGTYTLDIHDNHLGSTVNWDTITDAFHHDWIHFYTGATSARTAIYNNKFDGDGGTCCSTAFIFQEPGNSGAAIVNEYIYNNVFNQTAGNLFPLLDGVAPNPGYIVANTFQGGGSPSLSVSCLRVGYPPGAPSPQTANVTIEDNVFQGCNEFLNWGNTTLFTGWVVDRNTYMARGSGGGNGWFGTNNFATWKTNCACDANSTSNVSDTLNSDGTPQAGSPVIGAGISLSGTGLTAIGNDTTAGNTRASTTRTNPPDIGAFQFLSNLGTLGVPIGRFPY